MAISHKTIPKLTSFSLVVQLFPSEFYRWIFGLPIVLSWTMFDTESVEKNSLKFWFSGNTMRSRGIRQCWSWTQFDPGRLFQVLGSPKRPPEEGSFSQVSLVPIKKLRFLEWIFSKQTWMTTTLRLFLEQKAWSAYLSCLSSKHLFQMGDLVPKLSEMRPETRLLACRFPLPDNNDWHLTTQIGEGIDAVWIYQRLSNWHFSHFRLFVHVVTKKFVSIFVRL